MSGALSRVKAHGGIDLRCPDCASCHVGPCSDAEFEDELRCGNCGARFASDAAFISLADCEALIAELARPL